jgi:hypothetical protein
MGKGRVDEGVCRHDLGHNGRAKTSARLVHRYSIYQRVTNGSNPAHGEA